MWIVEKKYRDREHSEWFAMSRHEILTDAQKALWIAEEKHEQNSRYLRGEIFIFRIRRDMGLIVDRPRS